MLERIITALVLVAVVLSCMFATQSHYPMFILMILAAGVAGYEWFKLMPHGEALVSKPKAWIYGETEEDFQILLDWLKEAQLDRVGCFTYSPVEGATANDLPDHVPEEIKQERYERFMEVQQEISAAKLQKRIGQKMTVLVDSLEDEFPEAV